MAALAVACATLALTGCSGAGDVDVTQVLGSRIADTGLVADPGSLECDDVALASGATITCTLTAGGQPVAVTAKVASADGSTVSLDVSAAARPVTADVLGRAVAVQAGKQLGAAIDGAACAGGLQPEVGQATTCTLTSGSETANVTVTVASVSGGQIAYTVAGAA